jgi:hypothetical protein
LPNGQVYQGTTTKFGPDFSTTLQWYETVANSNYKAMQMSVERKAADVTFVPAYTYSKSIDNASAQGDWLNYLNYRLSRALSGFDMKHNFVASYNWAIPFDRMFKGGSKRWTQGWNASGITRFTSGLPVKISQSGDLDLTGRSGLDMPNVIAPVTFQNPRNAGPDGRPNTYFSTSSFTSEALGTIGDANRRFFYGPGIVNMDFGLSKTVPFTESKSIQIRAEFSNIFNHTNFNNPHGSFSSSTFGEITSVKAPRIGQVSMRFLW